MTPDNGQHPTVYLHIGTPKSGTTYLQSRFENNRKRAGKQGLLWPGPRRGAHVEPVSEVRRLEDGQSLAANGPWAKLVESIHSWSGSKVLISMEWLVASSPHQIAAAVESLRPCPVEIICTSRDLLRMFVAEWQEWMKNCRPWSWQQFIQEMVGDSPGPASERFWAAHDVPGSLQRWAEQIPWDRFHLVTVPPQGADPDLLWNRFCSVVGIDGSGFSQPPRSNESIGVVSATLMHRVNVVALAKEVRRIQYQRVLHHQLADEILASRREQEEAIAVSPEVDAWLRTRAQQQVDDLRKMGIDVAGDLDELLPGERLEGREPDDVSDSELLETCIEAMVELAVYQHSVSKGLREKNLDLRARAKRVGAGKVMKPGQDTDQGDAKGPDKGSDKGSPRGSDKGPRSSKKSSDKGSEKGPKKPKEPTDQAAVGGR